MMMQTISANEVKVKGVSLFDSILEKVDEFVINVRGKNRFVVLDIERYNNLRQDELDLAHYRTMKDIQEGKYKKQTASEHIKELLNEI